MATPTTDIFDRIKEQLDSGTVPWHKPWVVREDCVLSHTSGKPYSLRNRMLLSFAGEYATFYQIKKLGGTVKRGSKGKYVYFSKEVKRKSDEPDKEDEFYHLLRGYFVFNILDTDLPPKYEDRWVASTLRIVMHCKSCVTIVSALVCVCMRRAHLLSIQ